MKKSPQSIHKIMRKAPSIKQLLKEADADHNRLIQLRQMLPDELASHCVDVHLRNGRLVVYMNSPVWASRLRLLTPKITKEFGVRQLFCKVQVVQPNQTSATRSPNFNQVRHSQAAADLINSSATQHSDPEIEAILKRLANAVRPKS